MSQTVNVNFKMDVDTKQRMEQVCAEIGLSMSAAFNIFAKKVGNERRIPFELSADPFYEDRTATNDPFYSDANMERLRRSAAQMDQTGGTIHELGAIMDND